MFQGAIIGWFLATDLQLQPLAFAYCYFLIKSPKKAVLCGLVVGVVFLFANTYPYFLYDLLLAPKYKGPAATEGLDYIAHYHRQVQDVTEFVLFNYLFLNFKNYLIS